MWVCIKHDCSGMVGDECPHCATARLLQEEKERLLNTKNFPVDCQVSKKFAETIKNAIEQLTFMKSLLNHQGESASKKEINNCLGCKREKKINEIIEQLSKFSC